MTQYLSGIEEEDLVQDIYARLMADGGALLKRFDETRGSLAAFLTVLAGSQALNALRAKKRQAADGLDKAPEQTAPQHPGEAANLIPEGLLSTREALIIKCKYDRDLDAPDIAKLLGLKPATVRVTLKTALDKLRAHRGEILGETL